MKCKEIQEQEKINLQLRNKKKVQKLKEKGITLIALVVTIIILLILAGVTLNMAMSGDGLLAKARKAATDYNQKAIEEKLQLMYAEKIMEDNDSNSSVKTDVTDVLEEMTGGEITEKDIEEFNKLLEPYNEEIKGVTSIDELTKIGQDEEHPIDGVYVQLSDIEQLTTQIGSEEKPFKGVYNGNGKSINNLSLTAAEDYTGMFRVNEGTVKNVKIENCQVSSQKGFVGGVVGENKGLIENCIVSKGEINSKGQATNESGEEYASRIGGICGDNSLGTIKNCRNSAKVSGLNKLVGGICGFNVCGKLDGCSNFGEISGPYQVGGCLGSSWGSEDSKAEIVMCNNDGSVKIDLGDNAGSDWLRRNTWRRRRYDYNRL